MDRGFAPDITRREGELTRPRVSAPLGRRSAEHQAIAGTAYPRTAHRRSSDIRSTGGAGSGRP